MKTHDKERERLLKNQKAAQQAAQCLKKFAPTILANKQISLFPHDERVPFSFYHDATPTWNGPSAAFIVSGTEYRLKPIPTNPATALEHTMKAMVQLHHDRDSWRPKLQTTGNAVKHTLKDGTQCVITVWGTVKNRFVGVRNDDGTLHFNLPHPDQWADVGLEWLHAERCGCGRFDCDPAPFRRLTCPNADW